MSFEIVSQEHWKNTCKDLGYSDDISNLNIKDALLELVPRRATYRSAGYDFMMPFDLECKPNITYKVPTGFAWKPYGYYVDCSPILREYYDPRDNCYHGRSGKYDYTADRYNAYIVNPVLQLYPRSSLGFKYGFTLLNTVGIIDADYYNNPSNGGLIIVAFTVDKELTLSKGDKFCQGIVTTYGVEYDEIPPPESRHGGIGSTN